MYESFLYFRFILARITSSLLLLFIFLSTFALSNFIHIGYKIFVLCLNDNNFIAIAHGKILILESVIINPQAAMAFKRILILGRVGVVLELRERESS